MKGASKVMATMNRNMNIAGIQKLSMEFEKEHDLMEQRQEVMSDAMEDLHGNDDPIADDMVDETLKQVLDGKKQSVGILIIVPSCSYTDNVCRWVRFLRAFKETQYQKGRLRRPWVEVEQIQTMIFRPG